MLYINEEELNPIVLNIIMDFKKYIKNPPVKLR